MSCMHCCLLPRKSNFKYIKRWKNKRWNKKEDRCDIVFWGQKRLNNWKNKIQNPTYVDVDDGIFAEDIDGEEDGMEAGV